MKYTKRVSAKQLKEQVSIESAISEFYLDPYVPEEFEDMIATAQAERNGFVDSRDEFASYADAAALQAYLEERDL